SRVAIVAALLAVSFIVPLGAWLATGWSEVRRERADIAAEAARERSRTETEIANRIAARLAALRDAESRRPYYHYQNLMHDPEAADNGASIVPSPLARDPIDPLVWTYFQIDGRDELTVPTFNEDVPELNFGLRAEEAKRTLAALRPSIGALRAL